MSQPFPMPAAPQSGHVPVLLSGVLAALRPADGECYADLTFGAGGYSRAILEAASCRVLACDRDPDAIGPGQVLVDKFAGRLKLFETDFGSFADALEQDAPDLLDGVVLDIGVSSMQIDQAARGFSFLRDGPLDMRMAQSGRSAADVVAEESAEALADIIYIFGEEPKSRAIARAIVKSRSEAPLQTTHQLVAAIERATGPQRAHMRTHPATRTFQALRIYVNDELGQLADALVGAERMLKPGGRLVVVTFHSLEDRLVKQFLAERSGQLPAASRHAPGPVVHEAASFELLHKGHIGPSDEEMAANPRARSAKLRAARRTTAAAWGTSGAFLKSIVRMRAH